MEISIYLQDSREIIMRLRGSRLNLPPNNNGIKMTATE